MFQKQAASPSTTSSSSRAETVIGPSVKVEGDLHAVGNVVVEGIINGTLTTDKHVTIGEKAEITADVKSQSASIGGTIKGKLHIDGHLDIRPTARIIGDINTKTISIEAGAQINGQLNMGGTQSATTAKPKMEEQPSA